MVTLMRFNIFLIFICIFVYMSIELNHCISNNNNIQFADTIKTCFFISILFIISLTLFPIEISKNNIFQFNIIPFKTTIAIISSGDIVQIMANIFGNTILFVPLGFFSYFIYKGNKNKVIKLCLITTILIESIQFILPSRLFDIDDIMINFLGGYIGLILAIKFTKYANDKKQVRRI